MPNDTVLGHVIGRGQGKAMLVRLGAILAIALCVLDLSVQAHAERRVALLIGNASYTGAPLANPVNDVVAMKAALTSAGFDVVEAKTNLNRQGMLQALDEFETAVKGTDIGLVFYSGHGIEVNGTNYLIPIDATLASDRDVKYEAINLDDVLQALDGAAKLKLVLLDACRDNPFVGRMKRVATKGALSKGFAPLEAATANTLIAYAAAPGETALDGDGNTSPFTAALVKHLLTPGLDVDLALRRVRDEVMNATSQRQIPFKTGSLGGEPIIVGPPTGRPMPEPSAPAIDADAVARSDYDRAKAVDSATAWDSFLSHHPNGLFADLARAEREKLRQAHLEPPPPVAQAPDLMKLASADHGVIAVGTAPSTLRLSTGLTYAFVWHDSHYLQIQMQSGSIAVYNKDGTISAPCTSEGIQLTPGDHDRQFVRACSSATVVVIHSVYYD